MASAPRLPWLLLNVTLVVLAFAAGRALSAVRSRREISIAVARIPALPSVASQPTAAPPTAPSEREIRIALQHLAGRLTSRQGYDELLKQLLAWVAIDPAAALDYAQRELKPPKQQAALSQLLAAWAEQDPAKAWTWVSTQMPGNIDQIDAVLAQVGRSDSALSWNFAAGFAAQHPADARSAYVGALQGMIYAGSYDSALQLIERGNLPDGRAAMAGLVVGEWGRYDPTAAAGAALGLPDADLGPALVSLAQSWSDADPRAASDFAAQLPVGPARQAMLSEAVRDWTDQDSSKIGSWLTQYQQQPGFDQVVLAAVAAPGFISNNVSQAITLANGLPDDATRLQSLTTIFDNWLARDSGTVKNYLQSSPDLPPDTRAEIARRLNLAP